MIRDVASVGMYRVVSSVITIDSQVSSVITTGCVKVMCISISRVQNQVLKRRD